MHTVKSVTIKIEDPNLFGVLHKMRWIFS